MSISTGRCSPGMSSPSRSAALTPGGRVATNEPQARKAVEPSGFWPAFDRSPSRRQYLKVISTQIQFLLTSHTNCALCDARFVSDTEWWEMSPVKSVTSPHPGRLCESTSRPGQTACPSFQTCTWTNGSHPPSSFPHAAAPSPPKASRQSLHLSSATRKLRLVRGTYKMAENTMDMFFVEASDGVVLSDGSKILGYLHQSLRVGPERLQKFGWRTADRG